MKFSKLSLTLSLIFSMGTIAQVQAANCGPVLGVIKTKHTMTNCGSAYFCVSGSIDATRGLSGKVFFSGDSVLPGPVNADTPSIKIEYYSGIFTITSAFGKLNLRHTGVHEVFFNDPINGFASAHMTAIGGTGIYRGATDSLFINGKLTSGLLTSILSGDLCTNS